MKGIVIWAHSKCRSTYDLYCEVVRQAPVPVRLVFWKGALDVRTAQGFSETAFERVPSVVIGDDRAAADRILNETAGWAHVVAAYQVAAVMQHVMRTAKARGDRVVVYSEAPCEMCLGLKGFLKRLYYRLVLPGRMRSIVACADLILNQSGTMGTDRLMRLGWTERADCPVWLCKFKSHGHGRPFVTPFTFSLRLASSPSSWERGSVSWREDFEGGCGIVEKEGREH